MGLTEKIKLELESYERGDSVRSDVVDTVLDEITVENVRELVDALPDEWRADVIEEFEDRARETWPDELIEIPEGIPPWAWESDERLKDALIAEYWALHSAHSEGLDRYWWVTVRAIRAWLRTARVQ